MKKLLFYTVLFFLLGTALVEASVFNVQQGGTGLQYPTTGFQTGKCLTGNGLGAIGTTTCGGGSPGGTSGQVQYNANGSLGGTATSSLTASGVLSLSQPISILGNSASVLTVTGGANGQMLSWLNGVPTWTATSSINNGVVSVSCTTITCSGTNPATFSVGSNVIALSQIAQIAANSVVVNNTGATANITTVSTSTFGTTLYGVGTNGFVLAEVNGIPSWVATSSINNGVTSLTAGTNIQLSGSTGAVTITNGLGYPFPGNATTTGLIINAASSTITNLVMVSATTTKLVVNTSEGIGTSTPYAALTLDRTTTLASSTIAVNEYRFGSPNNATSTAGTIDCRTSTQMHWPLGTAATTLTLTGLIPGQVCRVVVENPNNTAGALTWAAGAGYTLLWPAGTVPTQTTTANKQDVWSFLATQASSTITIMGNTSLNF